MTASAIVVAENPAAGESRASRFGVVLHEHKRMKKWLQPGGHIDEGELPWDASVRETIEETGLPAPPFTEPPVLVHVDVHAGPRKHTHLDLRYVIAVPPVEPAPPPGESQNVRWFSWRAAIDISEPGLEGILRALQPGQPVLREARSSDASGCAAVHLRSRAFALPDLPELHDASDIRRWMGDEVIGHADVHVADLGGIIVGQLALTSERDGGWVDHLYIDPAWIGRGLGDKFMAIAKQRQPDGLQLWTFQSNEPAQRFYERHGFIAVERTDGAGNEERAPDVRYRWTP